MLCDEMWLLLLAVLGFASEACQGWEVVGELLPDGYTRAAIVLDDDRVLVIGADQTQIFSVGEGTAVSVEVPWKPAVREAALTRLPDGRILGMVTTSQTSNKAYEDFHCVWWADSGFAPAPCISGERNFFPVMPRLDTTPDGALIAVFGIGPPWVLYPPYETWTKLDVPFREFYVGGTDNFIAGHMLLPGGRLGLVMLRGQILVLDLVTHELGRHTWPGGVDVEPLGFGQALGRGGDRTWLIDPTLGVRQGPRLLSPRDYSAGMRRLVDGRVLVWGHSTRSEPNRVVEVYGGGPREFQYAGELCAPHPNGVLVEVGDEVLILGGHGVSTVERWTMSEAVERGTGCELRRNQLQWDLPIEPEISWHRELDAREQPETVRRHLQRLPEPLPDRVAQVDCAEYPCIVTVEAGPYPTDELADFFDERWFSLHPTSPGWRGPNVFYRALATSELTRTEATRARLRLGYPDLEAYPMPEAPPMGESCENQVARLEWELARQGRLRAGWPEGEEPVPERITEQLRDADLDPVEVHCEERPCVAVVVDSAGKGIPADLRALPEAALGRGGERWVVVFAVGEPVTDPAVARRAIRRMQELARPVE